MRPENLRCPTSSSSPTDEPVLRELLVDVLIDAGYRVAEAPDGQTALELVEAEAPDLILSDVMMPRMDGFAFVRELRSRGVGVPVILVSAGVATVELPGVRFLRKPFDLDLLLDKIGGTLGGR